MRPSKRPPTTAYWVGQPYVARPVRVVCRRCNRKICMAELRSGDESAGPTYRAGGRRFYCDRCGIDVPISEQRWRKIMDAAPPQVIYVPLDD